jgi:hypothetical protein
MSMFITLIIGLGVLLVIAYPERFLPVASEKKKRVGADYWGTYMGVDPSQKTDIPTIETVTIKKKSKSIAGSTSYDMGRGVSGSSSS